MSERVTIEGVVRWRSLGLLLVTILATAACRDGRPADPATTVARPLTVGATAFAVAPASQGLGAETTYAPKVACNASARCLVVWVQTVGTANYLFARRIDQAGPDRPAGDRARNRRRDEHDDRRGRARCGRFHGGLDRDRRRRSPWSASTRPRAACSTARPSSSLDNIQSLNRILVVNDSYVVIYGSSAPRPRRSTARRACWAAS